MKLSTVSALVGADNTIPGLGSSTVVPSDAVNFVDAGGNKLVARSLEILAAGDVSFVGYDGVTDTRTVPEEWLPYLIQVFCLRVNSTGTTVAAGSIKALW